MATFDTSVVAFDMDTCEEKGTIELKSSFRAECMSPDGKELYLLCENRAMYVINTERLTKRLIVGFLTIDIVSFTVDNEFIFISRAGGTVLMINQKTETIVKTLENTDRLFSKLAYNPERKILAGITYFNRILELWDTVSGKKITSLNYPICDITNITWFSTSILATASVHGLIEFRDIATRACFKRIEAQNTRGVHDIQISPCKRYVMIEQLDSFHIIRYDTGKCIYNHMAGRSIGKVRFSPDGDFLVMSHTQSIQALYLDVSFALPPPIHTGALDIDRVIKSIELRAVDGQLYNVGPYRIELAEILVITPETAFNIESPLQFRIALNNNRPGLLSRKRSHEEVDNAGVVCVAESEKAARDWLDALSAVRWHLLTDPENKDRYTNTQVTNRYRFDLLQLINSRNGGRGIVPGKTIPKDAMEIINNYMK